MPLFALTIFVSAFLLFLVQPVIAKQILPWFGGTAAVWSTCLVFFQIALLAGYFYSDWSIRKLGVRAQAAVHVALVLVALALLPIIPDSTWQPSAADHSQPGWRILLLLTATIGLPYFLLSTTSPLIQAWFARRHPERSPYPLFALSNFASMLALIGYPFLIEPQITVRQQAYAWSFGFGAFALLIAVAAYLSVRQPVSRTEPTPHTAARATGRGPSRSEKLTWIALAALGSSLLLGVSNHLTQNISSIPLLWVLPLAVYLFTFIVSFGSAHGTARWYPRIIALPQTGLALCAMAWLLADKRLDFMLYLHIIVFGAGLFIACMYCHGELSARKPQPAHLTTFYLMISIGGALGAVAVGIVAPLTLPAYYELGFTLYALAFLATWLLWKEAHWIWSVGGIAVCAFTLGASIHSMAEFKKGTIYMSRNFYGTLRVRESTPIDEYAKRSLIHGAILHGDQYLKPEKRQIATTYYSTDTGIGAALLQKDQDHGRPLRVGLIGLGAGTLAAYGRPGDVFRFYEINPDVIGIAQNQFTFLSDSKASIEFALGDARLSLEREPSQRFDVLVIDAFSSDSIPVHLITIEALATYEKHMQPDGIIAFHVSNRFLDLQPVVARLAKERGLAVAWIEGESDEDATATDWVLLAQSSAEFDKPAFADRISEIAPRPEWRTWTDDFNNIVQVLK